MRGSRGHGGHLKDEKHKDQRRPFASFGRRRKFLLFKMSLMNQNRV